MIEIRCPRCEQYWYSNEDEGKVRLCSRCVDHLRQKRGYRGEMDLVFLFGLAFALFFDLLLMLLTALMPEIFGKACMILALVVWTAGVIVLRFAQGAGGWSAWGFPYGAEFDWHLGRWGLLMFLSSLVLMGGCGALMGLKL